MGSAFTHFHVTFGLLVGTVFAIVLTPFFPADAPSLVLNFTPDCLKGEFQVVGGIAVALAVWLLYSIIFMLFRRQDIAIAKANVASLQDGWEK